MKPARVNRKGFVQIIIVAIIALVFGAAAIFGYQKYAQKSTPSPTPSSASTQTQTTNKTSPSPVASDETVTWKTYTNSEYNFSFKYPPDLYYKKGQVDNYYSFREDPSAEVNDISSQRFIVSIQNNSDNKTVQEFLGATEGSFENVNFNGYQAVKHIIKDCPAFSICDTQNNLEEYTIYFTGTKFFLVFDYNSQKDKKLLDQILSTFRFTN